MSAEFDEIFYRVGDLRFLDVTVRELEDLMDTGVDINAYRGSYNLLLTFVDMLGLYRTDVIDVHDKIKLVEQLVQVLLENGADPNLVTNDKLEYTCLGLALDAYDGFSWKICRLLVSHGIDVNAGYRSETKLSALYKTYDSGWSSWGLANKHIWLRMFIEAGADPMKMMTGWGNSLDEHVHFMSDYVEDVFMLDFYIEC